MWQHISEKHNWDILLLMGIHYNEILFFVMTRDIFNFLIDDKKIQGFYNNRNYDFDYDYRCNSSICYASLSNSC